MKSEEESYQDLMDSSFPFPKNPNHRYIIWKEYITAIINVYAFPCYNCKNTNSFQRIKKKRKKKATSPLSHGINKKPKTETERELSTKAYESSVFEFLWREDSNEWKKKRKEKDFIVRTSFYVN